MHRLKDHPVANDTTLITVARQQAYLTDIGRVWPLNVATPAHARPDWPK